MTKTQFETEIANLAADQQTRAHELAKGFHQQGATWEDARMRAAEYVINANAPLDLRWPEDL